MIKEIVFTMLFLNIFLLYGCPACVGVVHRDSPPFFSDEFYEPIKNEPLEFDTIVTGTNL